MSACRKGLISRVHVHICCMYVHVVCMLLCKSVCDVDVHMYMFDIRTCMLYVCCSAKVYVIYVNVD